MMNNMKSRMFMILPLFLFDYASSQAIEGSIAAKEIQAIQSHTGCYEVEFRFQETFPFQDGYQLAEPYYARAKEWVELIDEQPGKLSLQHILLTPVGPIKHWRQQWEYEATSIFEYQGQGQWLKIDLDADKIQGTWAQKVYQVDDSPRYECIAPWLLIQGRPVWECETASPLPRREKQRLLEYDILHRRNRHVIIGDSWLHEQDNLKIKLIEGKKRPLVAEKGLNSYRRLPDEECKLAANWWQENKQAWLEIQAAWDLIYQEARLISISEKQATELEEQLYGLVKEYKLGSMTDLQKGAYELIKATITIH